MGLTDIALKYLFGALSLGLLMILGEQEISLRHANSIVTQQLTIELQCRVGSTCAQKLSDEADRAAALVVTERAKADAAIAGQKAALAQQAVDDIRRLTAAAAQAQKSEVAWKQKYQQALQTPDCAAWAKQAVVCAVH